MSGYHGRCPECGGWGKRVLYHGVKPLGYECARKHRWDWRTGEDVSAEALTSVPTALPTGGAA